MSSEVIRRVKFVATGFVFILSGLMPVSSAFAADLKISWGPGTSPPITIDSGKDTRVTPAPCVPGKYFLGADPVRSDVCITDRGTWRFGTYTYYAPGSSYNETGYAIGFGSDAKMYRVRGLDSSVTMSNSNAMVYRTSVAFFDTRLNVVRNFPSQLGRTTNYINGAVEYEFNQTADLTLKRPNGDGLNVVGVGASSNGRWLAAELPGVGIVRINLETLEVRRISRMSAAYWRGSNPSVEFAVSNDGQHVAVMGRNFFSAVIDVSDNCGDSITDETLSSTPIDRPCGELDLYAYLQEKLNNFRSGYFPSFDEDGVYLKFIAEQNDRSATWVTMTAGGFTPPARLDYVALGDSYSSGEGDTEVNPVTKQKYYLPDTDIEGTSVVPREQCHVSTRSYPFLLRDAMNIPSYMMKSIACSGAVGRTDYVQLNGGYNGQNDRLGVLSDPSTIEQYKTAALNEFIPGRNQQIEFVKKYQPRAITLTAGGNDVDFGGVAEACASPLPPGCDYARTDKGKAKLGSAIAKQYDAMVGLYTKLHEASPETKIYVLGYPQFVFADNLLPCSPNVAFGRTERLMAREAVSYLNDVIQAAANSAGVKYIDIENSLGSNTLCGSGESYVTGLAMSGKLTTKIRDMFSLESFHPNAKGHKAIAGAVQNALQGQPLMAYSYCSDRSQTICPDSLVEAPKPAEYFASAMNRDTTNYSPAVLVKKILQKGKDAITLKLGNLEPNTLVNMTIFSDPTSLGTYAADGFGRLDVTIPIPPGLPAGFHTLEVATKTFSGEPITYWQIIEVLGQTGDIDENGVPDSEQQCLLVPAAGIDYDGDGTDDACDPEIGPAPPAGAKPSPGYTVHSTDGVPTESSQLIKSASKRNETSPGSTPMGQLVDTLISEPQSTESPNGANLTYQSNGGGNVSASKSSANAASSPRGASAKLYLTLYGILMAAVLLLLAGRWLKRWVSKK